MRLPITRSARAAAFAVLLSLCACGFTGDVGRHGRKVLVMNNMAEPTHLDPGLVGAAEDQRIALALFEGLTVPHPETLEPLPGVAESWEVSADGRRYRFRLRAALWSNGDPIRAADFVHAWRRVLTPPSDDPARRFADQRHHIASGSAELLYVVRGAEAWHQGRASSFAEVGVRALDDRLLEVELERPTPWFLELLSFPTFAPVHPGTVERFGRDWTRIEHFVGNGPFVPRLRRIGDLLRVERNPRYWDREAVGLDAIVYLSTDQIDTAIDQFLAGESDWVRSFNPKKVRAWRADPELSACLQAPPFLATYFYRFNLRRAEFREPRIRQALALATDRTAITRFVTGLGEMPALGIVPPYVGGGWRAPAGGLAYDPERARALLAEAGHPEGRGLPPITIAFNTDVKNRAVAEAVQEMWTRELGIEVRLENREKRVHVAREKEGDYLVSRSSWIADFSDPVTFLDFLRSDRANNRTGWRNADYDVLLDRAEDCADAVERLALLEEAERILCVEDPPILPIFHYNTAYLLRPGKFEGLHANPRNVHPPKFIRIRGS